MDELAPELLEIADALVQELEERFPLYEISKWTAPPNGYIPELCICFYPPTDWGVDSPYATIYIETTQFRLRMSCGRQYIYELQDPASIKLLFLQLHNTMPPFNTKS